MAEFKAAAAASFSIDDLEQLSADGEETPDLLIIESGNEKFRDSSDAEIDDKIRTYEGYLQDTKLLLKNKGKLQQHLEDLRTEQKFRMNRQSRLVASSNEQIAQQDTGNTPRNSQQRNGTRSMSLNGLPRGFITSSTVKTDKHGKPTPVHNKSIPAFNMELELMHSTKGKQLVPTDNSEQLASFHVGVPLVERGFNRGHAVSGVQAGPSSRDSPNSEQPEQWGRCNTCNSRVHDLSEWDDIPTCSVCRKKVNDPDPLLLRPMDVELQTQASKLPRRGKRTRQADAAGRTPDTAMELNSSDEEDKRGPSSASASACKPMGYDQPHRLGLRSTFARRMEGYKVAYPSRDDPDAVEILHSDLQRLAPLEFLNDTLIDFYIKYIQRPEALRSDGKKRFHFFNSFFYKKLSDVASGQRKKVNTDFSKLRKWTKGTNIFEKDYLFVPIHDNLHWSLAVICFPGADDGGSGSERCIIHLDSMTHGHNSQAVFRLLRSYLEAEWKHSVESGAFGDDESIHTLQTLTAEKIAAKKVQVPLQENESDCGLFLLRYIEKFVEKAPRTLRLSDLDSPGLFGREWFPPAEASNLRFVINQLLQELFEQEEKEATASAIDSSATLLPVNLE